MARVRSKARILERSITAGNGPYALGGAVDGSYNTFASIMAIGDTTFATVVEPSVAFWTGYVTYSATNQVTLTTVEETKGTFGAGTKEIFTAAPASRSMLLEDIAGAIITTGSSSVYAISSFRKYPSFAAMDGAVLAFAPHVANGVGPVINVDGLGNRSLLLSSSVQMESNVLSPGTPYVATYRNDIPAWVLHALGGNAYGIPLAAGIDYWAATTPSSAFAFPVGQALSRSTYAALFALMGTNYGAGDGSTTFNLPDKVGRGSVMQDVGGARISTATFNRTTLGGVGGAETATAPLPAHTHANTLADPGHQHAILGRSIGNISTGGGSPIVGLQTQNGNDGSIVTDIDSTGVAITNVSAGSGTGIHPNVQPSIVCNYIIRVL